MTEYYCPECGTHYEVIRVAIPARPQDRALCENCGHAMPPAEAGFVLVYKRLTRPPGRDPDR
jgi:uncharacterized Zn finger protein